MTIRCATTADAGAICAIYNQGIAERIATFETEPRTVEQVTAWFDGIHPIVVVEDEGVVIAFASTSSYRPRACYAGIAEFSVYVTTSARGRGAGRLAMEGLIEAASDAGFCKLVSRVFVENHASRRLLSSLGFREVGVYKNHGQLDGQWRDVVIVEKLLWRVCAGDRRRAGMTKQSMAHRYTAEFVGTFGIVFAPVALSASGHLAGGDSSLMAAALVSGLAVLAMIYALGHISAAHFNPAVTLGLGVAGRFPWRYVLPYWTAQLLGGIAAAALAALLFGAGSGANIPTGPLSRAVGVEATLTFFLMLVISAVATDKRVSGAVPGLAIGLTVVFDVLIGGPLTGGSMNPARSLGPALFAGHAALSVYWVYVIGPAFGAVIAARLYETIRGDERHAQGAPNDIYEALQAIEDTAQVSG